MVTCYVCLEHSFVLYYVLFIIFGADRLWKILQNCYTAAEIYTSFEKSLHETGFVGQHNVALPKFEKEVLELIAQNVTEGTFYALTFIYQKHVIVRYIESGCYNGFLKECYLNHVSAECGMEEIYSMKIYTSEDIHECSLRSDNRAKSQLKQTG